MQITIHPGNVLAISQEILELSRTLRRAREDVEDTERLLRQNTEMDRCRQELRRQEEALLLLTARMVNLSSALREIGELYGRTETRNDDMLEELSALRRRAAEGRLYTNPQDIRASVRKILGFGKP